MFVFVAKSVQEVGGGNIFHNLARGDTVFLVILHLLLAPVFGFVYESLHGVGHLIGEENHLTVDVTCGTSGGLHEATAVAEETFLVGIENGHKAYLGKVETFAQQVHSNQHIVNSGTEVFENLDALEGIDITMDICTGDAPVGKVGGKFFGHSLGEGCHQDTFVELNPLVDFLHKDIYLSFGRINLYFRVEEAGRTYNLLGVNTFALLQFIVAGRC